MDASSEQGSILAKLKSSLDNESARIGGRQTVEAIYEGFPQQPFPNLSRLAPLGPRGGNQCSQAQPLPSPAPRPPQVPKKTFSVSHMFKVRGPPPGAFKGEVLDGAQEATFFREWADNVPILTSRVVPGRFPIRKEFSKAPVPPRASLAALPPLDLNSQLLTNLYGPPAQTNPFAQPHSGQQQPMSDAWTGHLPLPDATAALHDPQRHDPFSSYQGNRFALDATAPALSPFASQQQPFGWSGGVVRPAAHLYGHPQQLPEALWSPANQEQSFRMASLPRSAHEPQSMQHVGESFGIQADVLDSFLPPSPVVKIPAPKPLGPSLELSAATLRKLKSLEEQRLSREAENTGRLGEDLIPSTSAQPLQPTAPLAAVSYVSPPKRHKLRKTSQEPTRAAREETIDPQLVDLDNLPSAPVAPATRKRQRAPKAEPGTLAENPTEHAVTTSEQLPQADEDALAAELCKAAGLLLPGIDSNLPLTATTSAPSAALTKLPKLPRFQLADAITVAICSLGRAAGPPLLPGELAAGFSAWHAAMVEAEDEQPMLQEAGRGGKAGSGGNWPGLKHVKDLGARGRDSEVAQAKMLACLKRSPLFVQEGEGWKLAIACDPDNTLPQDKLGPSSVPPSLVHHLETSGLLRNWQIQV